MSLFCRFWSILITLPDFNWQRLITRLRAKLMLILTALFWLLIFLPSVIDYHHVQTSSSTTSVCTVSTSINTYSTYCIMVGYYFLPILFILILFGLTWYNLRRLLRRRRSLEGSVTRMMLIQMCVILISGIPAGVFVAYILAVQNVSKSLLRTVQEYIASLSVVLLTYLTTGISFWIYLFASKQFRKHIKDYISNKLLRRQNNRVFITTTVTTAKPDIGLSTKFCRFFLKSCRITKKVLEVSILRVYI